jgi:hypothetical protein
MLRSRRLLDRKPGKSPSGCSILARCIQKMNAVFRVDRLEEGPAGTAIGEFPQFERASKGGHQVVLSASRTAQPISGRKASVPESWATPTEQPRNSMAKLRSRYSQPNGTLDYERNRRGHAGVTSCRASRRLDRVGRQVHKRQEWTIARRPDRRIKARIARPAGLNSSPQQGKCFRRRPCTPIGPRP